MITKRQKQGKVKQQVRRDSNDAEHIAYLLGTISF